MERIQRVNQLVKREISQIILRSVELPKDVLTTVTRVDVSRNLIQVKVYISVLPEINRPDVMKILNRNIFHLQQILNKRLNMRPMPKIIFVEEVATVEAGRIEELLTEIHGRS
jgi:ribosome-binding factor A